MVQQTINWANDANVVMTFMSFGSYRKVSSVTDPISKTMNDGNGKLIGFTSAFNVDGNGTEMFVADVDDVFSICETDRLGIFSEAKAPIDPDRPVPFGTQGREVPSASLSSVDRENPMSVSPVATGLAAGIAALLMTITSLGVADTSLKVADPSKLRTKRGM